MKVNRRSFLKGVAGAAGGLIASGGTLATVMVSDRCERNMIEIYAKSNPFIVLWFNGKDVSCQASGCRVNVQPGKTAWGWADFLVLDGDGGYIVGPDRCPLTHRRHGWVKWNRQNV